MALRQRQKRPYDIIVYGASGFTGQIVAKYLRDHAPSSLKWSIAGRSASKLQQVRKELFPKDGDESLDILLADSDNYESLTSLARQTKVVITTAGPYSTLNGSNLVAACVECGTDYVDLTGEPWWIRDMIDKHHAAAAEKGVKIVHCCGFDSVPSDLGTLVLVDHIKKTYNCGTKSVHGSLLRAYGGFSGGTIASGTAMLSLSTETYKKMTKDEYYLNQTQKKSKNKCEFFKSPVFGWQGTFIMSAINSRVVRRSAEMRGDYGKEFSYIETQSFPNVVVAFFMTLFLNFFNIFTFLHTLLPTTIKTPLLSLYARVLPKPGSGPSQQVMDSGFWEMGFVGESENGVQVKAVCKSTGNDPGYKGTAKMIAECGLCLALQRDALPKNGGILTPASAMGMPLIERLRKAGIDFDITP